MGRFVCELLEARPEIERVVGLGRGDDLAEGCRLAEVGFDFTVAGHGAEHARTMLAHGVRPIVGTSGVTAGEVLELDRLAREVELGGLVVPNFSLGMACIQAALGLFAEHFCHAEILEEHRPEKRDAPSATSLQTRELLALSGLEAVAIHSLRLPGRYAHQEVVFGGPGESVSLRHDMLGPEGFAPGVLAALEHVRGVHGVAFGLAAVLGSPARGSCSGTEVFPH